MNGVPLKVIIGVCPGMSMVHVKLTLLDNRGHLVMCTFTGTGLSLLQSMTVDMI